MSSILIKNAAIVNESRIIYADVLIKSGRIEKIDSGIHPQSRCKEIDGAGKYLFPGIIDAHVHFREPGLTHKADIYTESKAAASGGVTSFMEMPNTKPPALTQKLLEEKYVLAAQKSLLNYSFFMGVSNDNIEEVFRTDPEKVCGLKVFMGSSTGNMLVDNTAVLEKIFSGSPVLIAVHCEDETIIQNNLTIYKKKYGEDIPIECHAGIRSAEACLKSSRLAIELAEKHDSRLHLLHFTTEEETGLLRNDIPLEKKLITAEVCVHHLWFAQSDYSRYGTQIKCNPSIKENRHKDALMKALLDNRLDIVVTDHAPHTWEEKQNNYLNAPSGVPLVQHSLNMLLVFYRQGKISLEIIAEKMSHAPATAYKIKDRGFIREGYWADVILVDIDKEWEVLKDNIYYKCKWSPFEGNIFKGKVTHTFVNGNLIFENGRFDETFKGKRLVFDR